MLKQSSDTGHSPFLKWTVSYKFVYFMCPVGEGGHHCESHPGERNDSLL